MKKMISIFLLLAGTSLITGAQNRILQGVVHTLDSIPLEGVEVYVKSTGLVYETNEYGVFVVECNSKDKLKINADGFYGQNLKLKEDIKFLAVNLKMKPGNEPVKYSIGYDEITSSDNTSAISGISYKDIDFTRYNNVQDIIADNFAGVQLSGDGLVVRGPNTLIGSSTPLVVIDGVISNSDLNFLHPLDVKRIDVLKDGTSAVYGSRGANGVILIETKKGGEN